MADLPGRRTTLGPAPRSGRFCPRSGRRRGGNPHGDNRSEACPVGQFPDRLGTRSGAGKWRQEQASGQGSGGEGGGGGPQPRGVSQALAQVRPRSLNHCFCGPMRLHYSHALEARPFPVPFRIQIALRSLGPRGQGPVLGDGTTGRPGRGNRGHLAWPGSGADRPHGVASRSPPRGPGMAGPDDRASAGVEIGGSGPRRPRRPGLNGCTSTRPFW